MVCFTAGALAVALAACGDDGGSSADTTAAGASSTAAAPTTAAAATTTAAAATTAGGGATSSTAAASDRPASGEPIVTMTIASVNYNGPTYESGLITAKAFESWINARGGINGRPLKALVCDEQGAATGSAACARKAVSEGAIAVVGAPTFYGGNVESILNPANVSFFGTCCSFTPNEFNDSTAFVFSPDPIASGAAMLIRAADDGCKKIASMAIDIPTLDASNKGAESILRAHGFTGDLTFIKLPPASQDYSAEVALATKGDPDCITMGLPENQVAAVLPAFFATGSKANLYGTMGNFDTIAVKGFEDRDQVKNATILNFYADLRNDAYADFREALDAYSGDKKGLDYNSLSGLGTWTAFRGFVQVASSIQGEITGASFIEAASKTVIDNGGQTAKIDLSKPLTGGVPPYDQRVFNRTLYFQKLDGTALGTLDMQPVMSKL